MQAAADEASVMSGGRSTAVAAFEAAQGRRALWIIVLRILVGVAILTLWETASGRWIDKLFVSSPIAVGGQLWRWLGDGTLWNHLSITLYATVWGFAIGSGVGFALSLRDDDDEEEAAEPSGHPPVVSPEDVGAAVLRKLLDMTAAYLGHRQASGRAVKGWMTGCH